MKKQRFLPLALLLSFNLFAEGSPTSEFNQFFSKGEYKKAIAALEKQKDTENVLGQKDYLEGLCYSKLQEYDNAVKSFEKAIAANNTNNDLYYEYGQALYAANELKAARKAFQQSVAKKFNTPASIYYVAHISQILEELPEAKDNYTALIKNKEADSKIKQIARFQLAETLFLMMKEKYAETKPTENSETAKGVEKYIIPMMKQAHDTEKSTPVAYEINQRIQELMKEYGLDPDLLSNGRRVSSKRYSGYLSQKIKFDDNISLTNEENNVSQSKKESFIFESEAYGKYDFVLKKKFIVSPEARINFIQHSDQDSSEVYQNDSYSINTNLKNKYEHTFRGQPASAIFDIEYGKTNKDWNARHKREAYANTTTFTIGEAFNYFSIGDTTLKVKRKKFAAENTSISNNTTIISADQLASFANQHLLIGLFEADLVDNFNATSTSTNTYLLRFDYLIPEIMPKYTLGLAMATTITDTLEQKASRGTELTLNPSVDLSKEINQKMKISVNYDFTKNKSKSSSYSYQKNVFSTEFRYSF